ncbi:hypothetical protein WICMUC_002117 [Wickerhamomyces mucosus]|uniref:DASH complex subunit SPC19 n=1 Tax=Wickerhamomyces mucosus TaxID=1378264 RepID=A0A9P8PRC0_9ASCO|nr:hypothetical protein WICMUC_002117 [Wickerhamomyces mucosus]
MYSHQSTLNSCNNSLTTSVNLLNNSINSLDLISEDFQRLTSILDQKRIFTLIPEYDIITTKSSLSFEIEPKISKIVEIINNKLSKLERKNLNLISKIQLNSVRIDNFQNENNKINLQDLEQDNIQGSEEDLIKLRQLKLKKDRLKYKLSGINLQNKKSRLLGK